eukprot:Blabericola_migrator_1__3653@NODE_2094_length_3288_cov_45_723378_g329_i2_p1_GENE_NODE_2094_length_3288_cov_45_723378_g329_i2NODE_2094_length_3288_cov_45_723378_g329_i2_p1_ORF_typecomplete_len852_score92_32_NODE_2094_length_3288_cov_45_723378_g329_i21582713
MGFTVSSVGTSFSPQHFTRVQRCCIRCHNICRHRQDSKIFWLGMKGVILTPKTPRQWLPCCIVLIQPQKILEFSENSAWEDILNNWDSIGGQTESQDGSPQVLYSSEGLSWSYVSTPCTTTYDPKKNGDDPVLSAVEGNVLVADPDNVTNQRQSVQLICDSLDWVQELPDLNEVVYSEASTVSTGATKPPVPISEPPVTQLSYDEGDINQYPLDKCDADNFSSNQWLAFAEQSRVQDLDSVQDFDWVDELPYLDKALQPEISTVNTEAPPPPNLKLSVSEPSGDVEDSFAPWLTNAGQSLWTEASRIQTPSTVLSSQGLHLSQVLSSTQTNPFNPSLLAAQAINLPLRGELLPPNASTALVVGQSQVAHVHTNPPMLPQSAQVSQTSQAHLQLQEGPLNTRAAAAQMSMSTLPESSTSVEGPLISQQPLLAEDQRRMDTSQTESSPYQENPTSQMSRASSAVALCSLDPTWCGIYATQDQSSSKQDSSNLAAAVRLGSLATPKKRSLETTSEMVQKLKKVRFNSKYFEFKMKFMIFSKGISLEHETMSGVTKGLSAVDNTPLALMLRCFEVFTRRVLYMRASNFFSAAPGNSPWKYHWLCYAFSPNDQSCILDNELEKGYVLPAIRPDDVSRQVWAMITDTRKPARAKAFYNAVYQLHEAWKRKRRRPPPVEETVLDEVIEERLHLCERLSNGVGSGVVYSRLIAAMSAASQVFLRKPMTEGAARPDDEFFQLMMGVAGIVALGPLCRRAYDGNVPRDAHKQMAEQLLGIRYRGPNGESALDGFVPDPSAVRQCVKRGYLEPELLLSVTSELAQPQDGHSHLVRRQFILEVLITSASLFLRWSNLYEVGHV